MRGFEELLACAGTWEGRDRVKVMPDDPINESASRLLVTPLLRDTFVRFDQTWSWKDQPQAGSFLIGYDGKSQKASIHWIDTWHNGKRVMPLTGEFTADGKLVALGHFPVKDSPDWGWRIEIRRDADRLNIDMFCLNPDGTEEGGWVRSEFDRAPT